MTHAPPATRARLAWWCTAWLRGHVVTGDVLDAVVGDDAAHVVDRPRADGPMPLVARASGRLRAAGATGRRAGAARPRATRSGLGGPPAFNAAALEAGEAVVVDGRRLGLVPDRAGAAVTGGAARRAAGQLPDVGEADRDAAGRRWSTSAERARRPRRRPLATRGRRPADGPPAPAQRSPPPTACPRAASTWPRAALQALGIVELALEDDGGAVSAHEIEQRREPRCAPSSGAGRRALVAACSPEVWPPA